MVAKIRQKRVKTAKNNQNTSNLSTDKLKPKLASDGYKPQRNFTRGVWKKQVGQKQQFQGLTVFQPVDPYSLKERKEFRSAMTNSYVYRAARIQATMTVGQGYTLEITPRDEEEVKDEALEEWKHVEELEIPYWNKKVTPEQLLDRLGKMAVDHDLATNIFNGYSTAIEQGRCVLALTPLEPDDEGKFRLPEQIRLIRPEFTERPVINDNTYELEGCRIIGIESPTGDNILPADRMIYIMHGFNNELFSDYYGDSKISRVADEANTLNIVLNQDFERAAENTWYKPPIYRVPIPPQEFGNEENVLHEFLLNANDSKGESIAVTGPSNKDETGVDVITSPNTADIGGLEIIRTGLIKSIITAFGLPGFMLAEGDIGKLGGNANIEEIDSYLNTEIRPERIILENTIEKQYFDNILKTLYCVDDASKVPIKIKITFNKPKLLTLVTPDMLQVMMGLMQIGIVDESDVRDLVGLEEQDKETLSKGEAGGASPGGNKWMDNWKQPVQVNLWPNQLGQIEANVSGWGKKDQWVTNKTKDEWLKDKAKEWEDAQIHAKKKK